MKNNVPITVGRGPVPRHAAIVTENVRYLLGVERFLSRPEDRGGQAPALRKKKPFLSRLEIRGGLSPALRKKEAFSFNVNNFSLDKNREK